MIEDDQCPSSISFIILDLRGTFHTRHATTRAERAWHSPTEEREIDQERGSWKRPENVSVPRTLTEFYLQERDVPQGEKKNPS